MKIEKHRFGMLSDGSKVHLYTVSNERMSFSVTDFGCTLTGIILTGRDGSKTDVLLGFPTLDGYAGSWGCFGALIGRFANKIGKACFLLNGVKYKLDRNCGTACLHGGYPSWDKIMWHAEPVQNRHQCGIKFSRISPDGEQGFPGNLKVRILYLLDEDNNITLKYIAESDKPTPVSFTNHAYFNLAGHGSVLDHKLKMNSRYILETDRQNVPTGKFLPVEGTPYDFTAEKKLGKDIKLTKGGYDDCFVTAAYNEKSGVPCRSEDIVRAAEVTEPLSGRKLTVDTNAEGLQLYTANFVKWLPGKYGNLYQPHDAVCLETECFPDSPNKKDFPSCILMPGNEYRAVTIYGFEF